MTDQERLAEIKKVGSLRTLTDIHMRFLWNKHGEWLIEQAEQKQKLTNQFDEMYEKHIQLMNDKDIEITKLAEKVQALENRYDEQLEESQNTYNYFKDQIKKLHETLENIVSHADDFINSYLPDGSQHIDDFNTSAFLRSIAARALEETK